MQTRKRKTIIKKSVNYKGYLHENTPDRYMGIGEHRKTKRKRLFCSRCNHQIRIGERYIGITRRIKTPPDIGTFYLCKECNEQISLIY